MRQKVYNTISDINMNKSGIEEKAVTIGTFDGVHRGHVAVLDTLKKEASGRGLLPVAITFDRHPLELIAPERAPGALMSAVRKSELIRSEGVTPLVLPFTEELRAMSAFEWMRHIHRKHAVRMLVVGYDNTFGHDGVDLSIADYRAMGDAVGIDIAVAPEVDGVSSSAVRKAVRAGDILQATSLLGHRPETQGRVVAGFHVGTGIGFPTANLQVASRLLLPPVGVYAALAFVDDTMTAVPAMVNIGYRPTFSGGADSVHKTVEAHLIGVDEDLYGKDVRLEFIDRLRDERKFSSVGALVEQLARDRDATIRLAQEKS